MDVYYLAIAYLSTLRNWSSVPAYRVARFLYFYRLVGVVAFELTQVRALLLIFPNTFEYFFMAYEAIRSRWANTRWGLRWWIGVAAFIWVFIKLPQEWWIHVAQLDFTEFLADNAWAAPTIMVLAAGRGRGLLGLGPPAAAAGGPRVALRRGPAARRRWTRAPSSRSAYADSGAVWSIATLEKVVLLGLLSVIFAQTLPGLEASNLQLLVAVAVVVVVNAAFTLAMATRSRSLESTRPGLRRAYRGQRGAGGDRGVAAPAR